MSDEQFLPSFEGTWARLSQVAVNGAEYNSRERQPHPKCLEGTRVDLLTHIYEVLDDPEKNRLIWLHGTAGVGKSAVAFTVAERMRGLKMTEQTKVEERLGGTFFFSRKHAKRCTAGYFFATLAYQLAINFPSIRNDVNKAIRDNPALLNPDKSLSKQMEALFLQPLRKLQLRLRGCPPLTFVVDALDECTSEPEVTDLILSLARALRDPDLPVTHILLTSRSELHICKSFQSKEVQPLLCEIPVKTSGEGVATIISLDGADVDKDIYIFLQHSFAELASRHPDFPQPSDGDFVKLASRAGRRFIVASTMMKFIIDDDDDPHGRLQLMLKLTSELLPGTEVYKLYDGILSTCADPKRAYIHLSIVTALADPLPISQISSLLGPGLGWDVQTTLIQLRSVMDIPADSTLPVNIYHSSIRDYVSDPSNCSLPQVCGHDIPSPHSLLADSSLRLMVKNMPESTAFLDVLSELKKQSQAMQSEDPRKLKNSISFLVRPPESLSALICMLWLRGDRTSDLQYWLGTVDGCAWMQTINGRDWLKTEGGRKWLQNEGGQKWLQIDGGRNWLETEAGQNWLETEGARNWLETEGGRQWVETQAGRKWLETEGGRKWLETQRGQEWLQNEGGRDWLQTKGGRGWLQTKGGRQWLHTKGGWLQAWGGRDWLQGWGVRQWLETQGGREWLDTQGGSYWLQTQGGRNWLQNEGGRQWLHTKRGRVWLQGWGVRQWLGTQGGQEWLETQGGRDWLETQGGRDWLDTQGGRDWLQTQGGRNRLQTPDGQNWLRYMGGDDWLQTQGGQEWLQTHGGLNWLQTQGGRDWLQNQGGRDWLQTQGGRDWLQAHGGRNWLQIPDVQDWLGIPPSPRAVPSFLHTHVLDEKDWLETDEGRKWLQNEGGRDWLRTQGGRDWMQAEGGRNWMQAEGGRNWMQTQRGQDWLQAEEGRDWLQTQGGRDWLQTQGGRNWLQTPDGQGWLPTQRGRDWLQTLGGRNWLQTPHGQAWQSTPVGSVWATTEKFSSTLEAISNYVIFPELALLPAFKVIQQFSNLPDFLMFPVFLAFIPQNHLTSASPEVPDREIIHAMNLLIAFANEAQERSRSSSDALKYACQNWVVHLSRAPNPWDGTLDHIFKAFWNCHLLSWLERQWCLKGLRSSLDILSKGQKLGKAIVQFEPSTHPIPGIQK